MITLKARGLGKEWRMEVSNEVWEFKTREELDSALKQILDMKDNHGRIDKRE